MGRPRTTAAVGVYRTRVPDEGDSIGFEIGTVSVTALPGSPAISDRIPAHQVAVFFLGLGDLLTGRFPILGCCEVSIKVSTLGIYRLSEVS